MKGAPAVSLRGVRKTYGDFRLGPIDLEIESGYVVALVGPNGGGKSTMFNILMNLVQPDSGEVRLFGRAYPEGEVATKQRIGYVPERSSGHDEMSANALGEFVSRWYPGWDHSLHAELLDRLGTERGKKFGALSEGQKRRLSFALAASTGAELLLLDEPTAGLDPRARRETIEVVSRLMENGEERTVVLSTHVVEEVRRIADYVLFLAGEELLGPYEKDALLEEWKTFWVDRVPQGSVPGAVRVEAGCLTRIVSESPEETAQALLAQGSRIVRSASPDLEEILTRLMSRSTTSSA